jgi:transcriptional regulator with XRE-family HTH domain
MFDEWLLNKLKEMNWSQADLARASGLTRSVISKYMSGRIPDESALRKIAKAFKIPTETVFRAAGILPPKSQPSERISNIEALIDELSDDDYAELLEIARMKAARQQQKKLKPAV